MKNKFFTWTLILALLFPLSACSLLSGTQIATDSSLMKTIVAQNVQLTVMSGELTSSTVQTSTPSSSTSEALTSTTATLTPESFTSTPGELTLTINKNTNCRQGPASYYPLVVTLKAGAKVKVLGRNAHSDYFNVQPFASSGASCWVWSNYATLSGTTSGLSVFTAIPGPTLTDTPTPTPTQAPSFSGKYISLNSCGTDFSLRFFIKNTSSITWQSIKIKIVDNDTATTVRHISNTFTSYNGCTKEISQKDLAKGEEGYVTSYDPGQFGYDPTGHSLTVTVMLFSEDDQKGISSSQNYHVTP
jgi:hypothetical protein